MAATTTTRSWRRIAEEVIGRTLAALPADATYQQKVYALREAYPFGERRHHPYKVWCKCCRAFLGNASNRKGPVKLLMPRRPPAEFKPFLLCIRDRPTEAGPRLVFADYLEERGECDRAEKLRIVSCLNFTVRDLARYYRQLSGVIPNNTVMRMLADAAARRPQWLVEDPDVPRAVECAHNQYALNLFSSNILPERPDEAAPAAHPAADGPTDDVRLGAAEGHLTSGESPA